MIVVDASVVVEILRDGDFANFLGGRFNSDAAYAAPHLLDIEVVSALRGLAAAARVDAHRVQEYIRNLALLPVTRHSHAPLMPRVWELRHNFSAYDATYIALAELLDATLFTADAKLRKGHRARVEVIGQRIN
ncbi:MAG: type II toxin-antitoxin system VapC family toxin [Bryobacterales bacterium]|nr:type II toxin-antitoxin system VapC family toxin [Bryobacterales bacterium]